MKITALKAQVKDPRRISVYVDKAFVCGLSLDLVAELKIHKGQEVDAPFVSQLKRRSDLDKLYMRTLEWLWRRPRSSRELQDYFRRKQLDPEEQAYVRGKVAKYIDDRAFTRFWIEGRVRRNKSLRTIRAELRQKGVAPGIVEEVLAEQPVDQRQALREVIAKKAKLSRYQAPQKLKQYLLRQGFDYSDIDEELTAAGF